MTILAIAAPFIALVLVGLYGFFEHRKIARDQANEERNLAIIKRKRDYAERVKKMGESEYLAAE